jgi:Bacteriocin-protection, YdeI or OmpD-Associated
MTGSEKTCRRRHQNRTIGNALNRGHSVIQRPSSEVAVLSRVDELACRAALLRGLVANTFPHGTVHEARDDLQAAVRSDPKVFELWESLTPLGRNEFICWVDDAKQPTTRQRRIERTCDELLEGKKRPCCWTGCIHRTDKAPSRWQQAVLIDQKGKSGP